MSPSVNISKKQRFINFKVLIDVEGYKDSRFKNRSNLTKALSNLKKPCPENQLVLKT